MTKAKAIARQPVDAAVELVMPVESIWIPMEFAISTVLMTIFVVVQPLSRREATMTALYAVLSLKVRVCYCHAIQI